MDGASLSRVNRGEQHPTGNKQVPDEDIAVDVAMPTTSFIWTIQLDEIAVSAIAALEREQQQPWTKNPIDDHSSSPA